jgi:hypothetical protein
MKTLVRFIPTAAALVAALFVAGCASKTAKQPLVVEPVVEFAVMESSTAKELTPTELADLRAAVANYLQSQGLASDRLYYVKVRFPSAQPDGAEEWAIVRIGNVPQQTYTVLAAYPGADDYYPYDYYRYGYYARFSHAGYYDPYDYNYGTYRPPYYYPHPPGHQPGQPGKPGNPDGQPGQPTATPTRWNTTAGPNQDRPPGDYPPRSGPGSPGRWARDRAENSGNNNRTSTPAPAKSYSPPPSSPSPSPAPARSEPSPQVKDDSSRYAPQTNEK